MITQRKNFLLFLFGNVCQMLDLKYLARGTLEVSPFEYHASVLEGVNISLEFLKLERLTTEESLIYDEVLTYHQGLSSRVSDEDMKAIRRIFDVKR